MTLHLDTDRTVAPRFDPDRVAMAAVVRRTVERALATGAVVVGSVRAPVVDPARVPFLGFDEGPALAGIAPVGERAATAGEAWSARVEGPGRFAALRAAVEALWERIERVGDETPWPPRVHGGLSFVPGAAGEPRWRGFGDGRFSLARWTYRVRGDDAFLSFALDGAVVRVDASLETERALWELDRVLGVLAAPAPAAEPPVPVSVEHLGVRPWARAVEAVRQDIAAERVAKVVLARRSEVRLSGVADPGAVLRRLAARFPRCTCFAIRQGGATFVAATPERLFGCRGDEVTTEALAGSIDARDAGGAAALLGSAKDRAEHAFVVRDIARRLEPLCQELVHSDQPSVRELPHLLHLRTPIRGRLRPDVHALDLVEAMHPTPAVGGVPAAAALERIAAHEATPRGWYASPVGWLDAGGDGEMWVALRSGLLFADRAWIYAGAGIVRDSEPRAEYRETALKMRALLEALGFSEGAG